MRISAALLVFLAGVSYSQTAVRTAKDATLSGKITDSNTHQPIVGAQVSYEYPFTESSTVSDVNGAYSFHVGMGELRPDASELVVSVLVSKASYASDADFSRQILWLKPGASETRNFELSRVANISGRLTDRDSGNPIAGLHVQAIRRDRPAGSQPAFPSDPSGTDGSFAIANLAPGEYALEIDPPTSGKISFGDGKPDETGYLPTWFPGVPRADMAAPVTLTAGEGREVEVRIPKRELRHIGGLLQVPEGMESDGLSIEVEELTDARTNFSGEIPKAGPFRIDGLEEGSYRIRASTKTKSVRDRFFVSRTVELGDRNIDDLKLAMRPGVALHALITMEESKADVPADVSFLPYALDGWKPNLETHAGPLGFAGIPPGEYLPVLIAIIPGYALTSMIYDGRSVSYAPIDVETPESVVTFVLTSRPGRIIGTVRDENQEPISGATVALIPASIGEAIAKADATNANDLAKLGRLFDWGQTELIGNSDASGAFRFIDLAPGTIKALTLTGNDRQRARDPIFLRDALRSADMVVVEPSQAANLDIRITRSLSPR